MKTSSAARLVSGLAVSAVFGTALVLGGGTAAASDGTHSFDTRGECVSVRQSFENKDRQRAYEQEQADAHWQSGDPRLPYPDVPAYRTQCKQVGGHWEYTVSHPR